jgi:hypothetical protein
MSTNNEPLNPPGSKLTPEKLRTYPRLENLTDEQAQEAIITIRQLIALYLEVHPIENIICIDNQLVVPLEECRRAA